MKKLLLILGIGIWGIVGVQAQDIDNADANSEIEVEQNNTSTEVEVESDATAKTDVNADADDGERSRAGKVVYSAGHGAKEVGKGVKNGASWTWDKTKHNKLTKNLFNQPGDDDQASAGEVNETDVTQESKDAVKEGAGEVKEGAEKVGDEIDEEL